MLRIKLETINMMKMKTPTTPRELVFGLPFKAYKIAMPWNTHAVTTMRIIHWTDSCRVGAPKAKQSAAYGSVVANSTYSRIGAPKKKPSTSSVGERGETR